MSSSTACACWPAEPGNCGTSALAERSARAHVPPRALLAWSGGKDAAWALQVLRETGIAELVGLLSTLDGGSGHATAQGVRVEILRAQAAAAGLPLLESPLAPGSDNAAYERAFAATLGEAAERWPGITHIAFGDLLLADLRSWREALCARLGWTALFPLFGADTRALAGQMLERNLRATLCCVDTQQLDAGFAGRAFDHALLDALPAGTDPCGERGEFHTCVSDGPMFASVIALEQGATVLRDGRFACTDLRLAR